MFNRDFYCILRMKTVEFDGEWGDVAIIHEFDFYDVYYAVFTFGFRRYGGLCIS